MADSTASPIRLQRTRLGISIRELERRSGVNRGLLSLYERGRYIPTDAELSAIIAALTEVRLQAAFDGESA